MAVYRRAVSPREFPLRQRLLNIVRNVDDRELFVRELNIHAGFHWVHSSVYSVYTLVSGEKGSVRVALCVRKKLIQTPQQPEHKFLSYIWLLKKHRKSCTIDFETVCNRVVNNGSMLSQQCDRTIACSN